MRLHHLLLVLLSVTVWLVHGSHTWGVVQIVKDYMQIQIEVDRNLAIPANQRQGQPAFQALRALGSGMNRRENYGGGFIFAHLHHYEWMTNTYQREGPKTWNDILETADQWVCARLVDTLLSSIYQTNGQRWLYEEPRNSDELVLDAEEAIARMHESAQVELAVAFGVNDKVYQPMYMTLFQTCIRDHL